MSKVKNFNPALYKSHFDAVKSFIKKGRCAQYDFNVCTKDAANNALAYLCVNDIPHSYHTVGALGLYCITITWETNEESNAYCFWCEGEI